jgi:hypothetical protein
MRRSQGSTLMDHLNNGMPPETFKKIREQQLYPLADEIQSRTGYRLYDLNSDNVFFDTETGTIQLIDIERMNVEKTTK